MSKGKKEVTDTGKTNPTGVRFIKQLLTIIEQADKTANTPQQALNFLSKFYMDANGLSFVNGKVMKLHVATNVATQISKNKIQETKTKPPRESSYLLQRRGIKSK